LVVLDCLYSSIGVHSTSPVVLYDQKALRLSSARKALAGKWWLLLQLASYSSY